MLRGLQLTARQAVAAAVSHVLTGLCRDPASSTRRRGWSCSASGGRHDRSPLPFHRAVFVLMKVARVHRDSTAPPEPHQRPADPGSPPAVPSPGALARIGAATSTIQTRPGRPDQPGRRPGPRPVADAHQRGVSRRTRRPGDRSHPLPGPGSEVRRRGRGGPPAGEARRDERGDGRVREGAAGVAAPRVPADASVVRQTEVNRSELASGDHTEVGHVGVDDTRVFQLWADVPRARR